MGDLSKHFSRFEFACKCGCGFDTVDTMLLEALESIREKFNCSLYISSSCRCFEHNKAVGGAKNSQHTKGRAADINTREEVDPDKIADYAESLGLSVGRYANFTHVDTRTNGPARWDG